MFNTIFSNTESKKYIVGLNKELQSLYLYNKLIKENKSSIYISPSLYEASLLYQSIKNYTDDVLFFPMDEFLTSEALAISPEFLINRLESMVKILTDKPQILVTNLMGFLRFLPSKETFKNKIIKLSLNDEQDIFKLKTKLLNLGYQEEILVNRTGEIAVRGFVIDIYPLNYEHPVRIEFFGDNIESIRLFDVDSQKTIKKIDKIEILPVHEFLVDDEVDQENLKHADLIKYINVKSIKDYMIDPDIYVSDDISIANSALLLKEEIKNYNDNSEYKRNKYMHDVDELLKDYVSFSQNDNCTDNTKTYNTIDIPYFPKEKDQIEDLLNKYLFDKKTVVVCLKDRYILNKVNEEIITKNVIITSEKNIYENKINLIIKKIESGFGIDNYIVISEKELFNKKITSNIYNTKFNMGTKVKDITKIKKGDYVVHFSHGIGQYLGITKITKNGLDKDYITLKYKNDDKLYVPVEKIEVIKKYSDNENLIPNLNRLGSSEWEKTKQKIKNRVKDIADELLKLYAIRETKKGYSFDKDNDDQTLFESYFEYKMTPDQLKVIDEIKKDMEKEQPMDRLLCGDVGFGKTEVAFRAMFKAVNSGKQVALLCPTTILSSQHYKNAIERFKNFPINIALINRFISTKEMTLIKKKLSEKKIDIIIGTHRILSDDIVFKDLGLLVIDEEQRFGVIHKEKIKKYKTNVDVLTLTATPIPRTLQMTFSGLRNLSLIETPPSNRYPVQTYVLPYNKQIIKDAIYKEKSRNGQVFILFNKIKDMDVLYNEISRLVPDLKVVCAHGKMDKNVLEDVMIKFTNYEYDILICTTIIETGIDIPRVNTLIIIDANNFGLSQLYQIRGRVGRSDKIAYCYLMHSEYKAINDIAMKRLNILKQFTKLGSGFSIAMRDLSIRGAGDILGSEQAGFIESVGVELFLTMLEEEVKRLKQEDDVKEQVKLENPLLEVDTSISDNYISSEELKIEVHKKINSIDSLQKLEEVKKEIEDRFGKVDEKLLIYMYEELFEFKANMLEITKVKQNKNSIEIILPKKYNEDININELYIELNKINKSFRLSYNLNQISVILDIVKLDKHFVYYLIDFLDLLSYKVKK